MALRRLLHARGLRYRVHVRPVQGVRAEIDIAFGPARVAVLVDGCFWHGCPLHATWPKTNAEWWRAKIERNRERDRENDRVLQDAGWLVLRVWEHEPAADAAARVHRLVLDRRARRSGETAPSDC